jgi:hypothetical protein
MNERNLKMGHEHENHQEEKEKIWREQEPIFEKIQQEGGFSNYVQSLKNLEDAFHTGHDIHCIDEGTPGGIHSAGSGILMSREEAVKAFKEAGVTGVTSHEGCGAAKLYAIEKELDPEKADEYGEQWAKELAIALNVPYEGHMTSEQMARPESFHIARVAYYDGTGKFDYSATEGLPPGFIISRKFIGETEAEKEIGIAESIAMGDHGFGDLITEENPFLIVVIGDSEASTAKLKQEIENISHNYGKRIKVDSFVAPEHKR